MRLEAWALFFLASGTLAQQVPKALDRNRNLNRLPLGFEENTGQFDRRILFLARSGGLKLSLTREASVISLGNASATVRFSGASRQSDPTGIDLLPGVTNYITGNDPSRWKTGIHQYRRVRYESVYPGISVDYYGNGGTLEFDFSVQPGADPSEIRMAYDGVQSLRRTPEGDLALEIAGHTVLQRRPTAWQTRGGKRVPVAVEYRVGAEAREATLQVAVYDRTEPLVIDPVLQYGTYFGGTGNEGANSLAVDSAGNTYITGRTTSTNLPPSPAAPFQSSLRGPGDAFVTKINAAGTALVYTTYIGGTGDDEGKAIAVDSGGTAYICGVTTSTNFPSARGGVATYYGGAHDAFFTVLNSAGNALVYSGYLGGPGDDVGNALTLGSISGGVTVFMAGYTNSATFTGVGTSAAQPKNGGGYDAFIISFSQTLLVSYGTFFGGTGDEFANGIAVFGGEAYVAGSSTSPALPGAASKHTGSKRDAFLAVVNPSGNTFYSVNDFGGTADQSANAIAVDSSYCYLTGFTNSGNFPVTEGSASGGGQDAFITVFSRPFVIYTPSKLTYSTYLGGRGSDAGYGIQLDRNGNIYVAGYTDSPDFLSGLPNHPNTGANTFVAELSAPAQLAGFTSAPLPIGAGGFTFVAYLGASDAANPVSLAVHPTTTLDEILVAGYAGPGFAFASASRPPLFGFAGGTSDAFVAKLGSSDLSLVQTVIGPYVGSATPGTSSIIPGSDALLTFAVRNSGPDVATNIKVQVKLLAGLTFLRCLPPATCIVSGSTITISFSSLNNGAITPQIGIVARSSVSSTSADASFNLFGDAADPNLGDNFQTRSAQIIGQPSFQVSTLDLNFGGVALGQPASQSLTITPTGIAATVTLTLTLNAPSVFGPGQGARPTYTLQKAAQPVDFIFTPLEAAPYTGSVDIINADGGESKTVILEGSGSGPTVTKIEDSAGFGATITDNGWVTLLGTSFTAPNTTWPDPANPGRTWLPADFINGALPTSLEGVSVRINRQAAFVEYVSPTQINVLAPPDPNRTAGPGTVDVEVRTPNGNATITVTKDLFAPGIFSFSCNIPGFCNDTAHPGRYAAATSGTAVVGHAANPVRRGQILTLYMSGMGDTRPQYDNSRPVSQLVNLANTPTVTIGGAQADVGYAGMVISAAGLYQLNVTIPQNAGVGDQPLTVTVAGHSTPTQQQTPVFLNIVQ